MKKEKSTNFSYEDVTYWMDTACSYPLLPREEVLALARTIQSSEIGSKRYNKCVNKLVNHNLRLVIDFVRKFMHKFPSSNNEARMSKTDLLQQGSIGLIRAAQLYDPTRGYAFSTYAIHWIRQSVTRYYNKYQSCVLLPESAIKDSLQYSKGKTDFTRKGRPRNLELIKNTASLVKQALAPVSGDSHEIKKMSPHCSNEFICLWDILSDTETETYSDSAFSDEFESLMEEAGLDEMEDLVVRDTFLKEISYKGMLKKYEACVLDLAIIREAALRKIKEAYVRLNYESNYPLRGMASISLDGTLCKTKEGEPYTYMAFTSDAGKKTELLTFSLADTDWVYAKNPDDKVGQYYRCQLRGPAVKIAQDRLRVGMRVGVVGQLIQREWNGQRQYHVEVDRINYGTKKSQESSGQVENNTPSSSDMDDIPF